uniref:RHS repeat domain-containing protein n=2 Tax=Lysinibacillus TaxID=400634 RepID=UPI0009B8F4FA
RFRYYDPEQGNYTQIDPIGLMGDNPTLYGYVCDPNLWIDPLGLINWGGLLINAGINKPEDLIKPHGHHIVFKGSFARDARGPVVSASQQILRNYGIDVERNLANLMWASNIKGVHTLENAEKVLKNLKRVDKVLQSRISRGVITDSKAQEIMEEKLQFIGKKVFDKCSKRK